MVAVNENDRKKISLSNIEAWKENLIRGQFLQGMEKKYNG